MLLAIDAGNTNIGAALFAEDKICKTFKTPTDKNLTSQDFGRIFTEWLNGENINAAVIGSVVAELTEPIKNALHKISPDVLKVTSDTYCGFKINYGKEVKKGADILATNAAANKLYGDCIIIDAGTATTIQILDKGEFIGCVIAPGMLMGARALHEFTSLLPLIEVKKSSRCWGMNTVECMEAGIFYGHAAMIEGMISRIEAEVGHRFKTIATGGTIPELIKIMKRPFDVTDYDLIYKGLKIIYDINTKNPKRS